MAVWPDEWRDWSGGIEDLVNAANTLIAQTGHDEPEQINERLVRYYQSEGALGRGQREGKAARYGFRELAALVATRRLLAQGWRLATIAETLPGLSDEALAAAPSAAPPPAAADAKAVIGGLLAGTPARSPGPATFAARAYARTVEKSAVPPHPAAVRAVREFRPAAWLIAQVGEADLATLDDASLDTAIAELRRLLHAEADAARRRR